MRAEIHNVDCVKGMRGLLAGAVRKIICSIPFGALFAYSAKREDVGNCRDGTDFLASQFGLHMRFVVAEMFRVLSPGCIASIHVQQLNASHTQHGYMGMREFVGDVVRLFERGGFQPHGEVAIPKDPQRVAQTRKLHSLLFATGVRDSRALAPCVNDYVLFFRKPGDDGQPVHGLAPDRSPVNYSKQDWILWARGVWELGEVPGESELEGYAEAMRLAQLEEWRSAAFWGDIVETDVLESWQQAREEGDEKHVCPLQLEVIRRCLLLYTNPGDLVLDPFMGIGSTAWVAIEQGREVIGFELKDSYAAIATRNVATALAKRAGEAAQMDIFSALEAEGAEPEIPPQETAVCVCA